MDFCGRGDFLLGQVVFFWRSIERPFQKDQYQGRWLFFEVSSTFLISPSFFLSGSFSWFYLLFLFSRRLHFLTKIKNVKTKDKEKLKKIKINPFLSKSLSKQNCGNLSPHFQWSDTFYQKPIPRPLPILKYSNKLYKKIYTHPHTHFIYSLTFYIREDIYVYIYILLQSF